MGKLTLPGVIVAVAVSASPDVRAQAAQPAIDVGPCIRLQDGAARLECFDQRIGAFVANEPRETILAEWSGVGLSNPRPFRATGAWEFQWRATGFFQVSAQEVGTRWSQLLANQATEGDGASYVGKAGEFVLQINAMRPWTARVVLVRQR